MFRRYQAKTSMLFKNCSSYYTVTFKLCLKRKPFSLAIVVSNSPFKDGSQKSSDISGAEI